MTTKSLFSKSLIGLAAVFALLAYFVFQANASDDLRIVTDKGAVPITVEIADTDEERRTGLMFREEMAADHGMLFVFDETRMVSMWMENTLIPLDMLFIGEDGTIRTIGRNAKPLSRDIISSKEPVRYVLELNGGAAARLGIAVGDKVEHEAITGEAG
ncbi:MAG: DUF192 domain-containing protein [Fulvimarina manganoxydans]|uniref:DUF192 domain-containing protein n=1 Tax=Fulvimarina manganoxydans TaxID=937218 RepID=UPI002354891A|nr:DUF192 domain-containing protein [Fulvimarina manganoxydans]MCK5931465.1 DUF192 domain-containing protein [Fulvimarina manganoxydans]